MKCRVGSIVVSTNQGLGYLMLDFYKHGIINKVLIQESPWFESNPKWYGKDKVDLSAQDGFPYSSPLPTDDKKKVIDFLETIDVLLFFETPFNLETIELANKMNVKCILMPMYECTPYPINVHAYLSPSVLDFKYYMKMNSDKINKFIGIPVPDEIKWKKRTKATTFIHNAGNGGTQGRNGTKELIEAMQYVKSPIKLLIRSQSKDYDNLNDDNRIEIIKEQIPFEELWSEGDVFVFPEKFNGLSLPIQEAYASGLLIMSGDRFPFNYWLPAETLIPVKSEQTISIVNVAIQSAVYDPRDIATTIDKWYNKDITDYSIMGREWAKHNSWKALKPKYLSFFQEVLNEDIITHT